MSYRDLNAPDGSIRRSALMSLALRKAHAERAECLALGYAKPWRHCLSEALKRVWEIAKAQRDACVGSRYVAIEPAEALRRELDLIPYREDSRAAEMRRRVIEAQLSQHAN
jgi:hypothetical protein